MKILAKKPQFFFIILTGVFLLLFLLSIPSRKPHIDDAWLGEHSYWLVNEGVVKTKLMTGIANGDERLILHHKLFTLQGALVIACCGFSLPVLKSISLVYLIFLVGMLFFIYKNHWFTKPKSLSLILLLLLSNPLIFEFGFVFRPEIMLALLGLISAFLIIKPDLSKISKSNAFISGLIAGLSLTTHLNGSVFIASGFLFLLMKRKWSLAFIFAAGSIITSLIYFYDFQSFNDISYWIHQLTFIPSDNTNIGVFKTLLISILDEQRRYFHSPKEIIFTTLIVVSLFLSWKKLKKEQSPLLLYTLLTVLSMSVLALNKTSKYFIMVLPFIILIISRSYFIVSELKNKKKLSIFNTTLLLYLVISILYNLDFVLNKFDPKLNAAVTKAYAGSNPQEIRVLAPMEFIFNEIEQYERIVSLMSFNERLKINQDLTGRELLRQAKEENINLVLLPEIYQKKLKMNTFELNDTINGFKLLNKQKQLMVWSTIDKDVTPKPPQLQYSIGFLKYSAAFD